MHPFLNLSELSISQLYDKAAEIVEYVGITRQTGSNHAVMQQLELSLQSVYDEIESRTTAQQEKTKDPEPVAWDMESSLRSKRNRVIDAESENKKNQKRRWRPSERTRRGRSNE